MEPDTESVFVLGFVIFVSGELSGGCQVVLELGEPGEPGEPLVVEFRLPVGGVSAGEAA